jgi:hypothetical protein
MQHNNDYIDLVSGLLQSFNSQVQQAVRQDLSLVDTRKKVDVASFEKQFAGDNLTGSGTSRPIFWAWPSSGHTRKPKALWIPNSPGGHPPIAPC